MIITAGAGLLGEIGCIAAGALDETSILKHLAFLFIVIAGILLANARITCEYLATCFRRELDANGISNQCEAPKHVVRSVLASTYWHLGLLFVILGALVIAWHPMMAVAEAMLL